MGLQRKLRIYIGFESPSIIKYLEHLTCDIFTARFSNCQFDETCFPALGGEKKELEKQIEISWNALSISHFDPRTNQCELEVQRIIHLHNIANQLPDAFVDTKKVTKACIPAANVPTRIDVHVGQIENASANESKACLMRGRPISSKDKNPWKRKGKTRQTGTSKEIDEPEEAILPKQITDINEDKTHKWCMYLKILKTLISQ